MADVLSSILAGHGGKSLDIATAYFNIRGFTLLQPGLQVLGSFRLLLGDEPQEGESVGLRPRAASRLIRELNEAPFSEETLLAVEDLVAFLRRDMVDVRAYSKGFLHAKGYIFYGDLPVGGADRFQPIAAIVGSSNFTGAGLVTNRELNLSHKTTLSENEMARMGPPPVDGREENGTSSRADERCGCPSHHRAGPMVSESGGMSLETSRKNSLIYWTHPSSVSWSTLLTKCT